MTSGSVCLFYDLGGQGFNAVGAYSQNDLQKLNEIVHTS